MLSEFQKRKIALAYYKWDQSKDGIVKANDFEIMGKKAAELLGVQSGSPDYSKIIAGYQGLWTGYFKPADKDGDNSITLEEYIENCATFVNNSESSSALGLNKAVFDSIDLDGSGKITASEYAIFLKSMGLSDADAASAFSHLDRDGSGSITQEEFAQNAYEYFTSDDPNAVGNWFYGSY